MKTYEITKEQILELQKYATVSVSKKIKNWFPDAFKEELEVGKWYRLSANKDVIVFYKEKATDFNLFNAKGYGFYMNNWEDIRRYWTLTSDPQDWALATPQEVETALINEAKKRGFVEGVECNHILYDLYFGSKINIENEDFVFDVKDNSLDYSNQNQSYRIFKDGVWAKIIEQKEYTMQEIANALNIDVNNLKIKK